MLKVLTHDQDGEPAPSLKHLVSPNSETACDLNDLHFVNPSIQVFWERGSMVEPDSGCSRILRVTIPGIPSTLKSEAR